MNIARGLAYVYAGLAMLKIELVATYQTYLTLLTFVCTTRHPYPMDQRILSSAIPDS